MIKLDPQLTSTAPTRAGDEWERGDGVSEPVRELVHL